MRPRFTLALALTAFAVTQPTLAADRQPSGAADAEELSGFNDRPLTYVLIAALIAAIVIATVDDGTSGETPASP